MTLVTRQKAISAATAMALIATIAVVAADNTPASSQQPPATVQKAAFSKDSAERATELDLARKGPSAGDRIVTRGPFFDASDTSKKVGSYTGELLNINPATLLTQMNLTMIFPEGQITVAGSLAFRRTLSDAGAVLPITGGTGAYAHASGTATMRARKLGRNEGFLFNLDIAR